MIVTLTMNPALDKSTTTRGIVPDKKMRCSPLQVDAGGGGINISRALKELGSDSLAIFPSGGMAGQQLENLLAADEISFQSVPVGATTRENFMVTDLAENRQFRFIMPGDVLSSKEVENCFAKVTQLAASASYLIFSGSLPQGVSDDFLQRLAAFALQKGIPFLVDTSGEPLRQVWQRGAFLIKPNLSELCLLDGKAYLKEEEIEEAALRVFGQGNIQVLIVSMGPLGALLVSKEKHCRIPAPAVQKVSTVGAGDCMMAGIVYMLSQHKTLLEAVQLGVACGTAAILKQGAGLFHPADVWRFYEWIKNHTHVGTPPIKITGL